ncbi:MAG TPA: hypothetical protein VFY06_11315 [Verrucomicrobiae bacterium]|nr:hypothetical protein [Verrucomicrobiae bacterium]
MSRQKLLKAPARLLLLTFVVSAGVAGPVSASTPRHTVAPAHGHRHASIARSRTRQEVDYSKIEGIQRWGLNE